MAKAGLAERPAPRLTQYEGAGDVRLDAEKAGAAAYRRVGDRWLVTSDAGHFAQLAGPEFRRYLEGKLDPKSPLWGELQRKGLIRDHLDFDELAATYRRKNEHLFYAPLLHIIVTTLRCNHKCLYCHSSVVGEGDVDRDMSVRTAKQAVDFAFRSPNKRIVLEFQGGEPLLNWPVVKFVTRYSKVKNEAADRLLFLALISNFSLMDDEKFRFLIDERVGICTSLDGPAEIHDRNRLWTGGNSHAETVAWLRRFQEAADAGVDGKRHFKPGALFTATRQSFAYGKRAVDEYIRLGLPGIFLRPLSPIGFARRSWHKIGYSVGEFLDFYRETLDYVIELNRQGVRFHERAAVTLLTKILEHRDPGYVDLRSPSGAAFGVLSYDYDGSIFTGDEARMLAQEGDRFFRVGHVAETSYNEVMDHPVVRAAAAATLLENQPLCSQCAYKPYCGLDSVYNRETQRNLWGQMPSNDRCRLYMGLFDILFERLQDPSVRAIFESWLEWAAPGAAPPDPAGTATRGPS